MKKWEVRVLHSAERVQFNFTWKIWVYLPVCVMRQSQAGCVNSDGRQHHSLGLRHREVFHSHLLKVDWQFVQSHSGQMADHQGSQHGQHSWTGHLRGSRFNRSGDLLDYRRKINRFTAVPIVIMCVSNLLRVSDSIFCSWRSRKLNPQV